ncbi:MAG: N-6 DNA methylase, partial [Gammaproteobacteria bacterium]|nr:N-6 DNA methylase [Gammaproteobacteria bacterium]
ENFSGVNQRILDLGCGEGVLGVYATSNIRNSLYVGVELDQQHFETALTQLSEHEILQGDVTSSEVEDILCSYGKFDYAVGNPPYVRYKYKKEYAEIIHAIFPHLELTRNGIRSEIIFLAKALGHLKKHGTISFILPRVLFSSDGFATFRRVLLEIFSDIEVISLPDNIFNKADVSTCLLRATDSYRKQRIRLSSADKSAKITDTITVTSTEAIHRMDYYYHSTMKKMGIESDGSVPTLQSLGVEIKRGSRSKSEFIQKKITHFHTADFPDNADVISLGKENNRKFILAEEGDVLTPRVGTRILDRQVMVAGGALAITDCVYRLRTEKQLADKVLSILQSKIGITWRKIHAKGSCAKYITNSDMLSIPILN